MSSSQTGPHPLDPLTSGEIQATVAIVRESHKNVHFNIVSLHEPRKAEMSKWLAQRSSDSKPRRMADVCVIAPGGKVGDGLVDLNSRKIAEWKWTSEVQPIVSGRF